MIEKLLRDIEIKGSVAAIPDFDPFSIKEDFMSPRVLVVDNDHSIRAGLVDFLKACNLQATAAETPYEALDLIYQDPYNVAIVDIRLPGMDGGTMIQKANEIQPSLNFIIHTGSTTIKIAEPLSKVGIRPDQVFLKPVKDVFQFVKAIKKLLT
jgi:DNA-binding NtrC family response regulator